ncbi:MAG: VOC family protein [Arenimonas sp.]
MLALEIHSYAAKSKENNMTNPFVHVELNTTDLNKAQSFYGKLFDWKTADENIAGGTYTTINAGEGTGGGMMAQKMPGAPSEWLPYVAVEDIEAATQKAKKLGALILKDVTEVPDMGWFSIITDPTGAHLGLWKPKPGLRKN